MFDHPDAALPNLPLRQLMPDLPTPYNYDAGLDAALEGLSYEQIAQAMGCSKRTLVRLRQDYVPFNDTLSRARAIALEYLADDLRCVVEQHPEHHGNPQLLKTLFEAGKWYLSVSDPKKYGDKMHLEVTERVDLKSALQQAEQRVIVINASKQTNQAPPQADTDNTG